MELWDVLNEKGEKTGRLIERGKPLEEGEYHLVVDCWLMDGRGRFLITRRSPEKDFAGLWEPTTGSAIAGEDSFTAVRRETLEETGIEIFPEQAEQVGRYKLNNNDRIRYFRDVWLVRKEFSLDEVVLQPGETDAAMAADKEAIYRMIASGEFLPKELIFYIDDMMEKLL